MEYPHQRVLELKEFYTRKAARRQQLRFKIKMLQTYGCVGEAIVAAGWTKRNEGDGGERVTDVMKELNIEDGEWIGIET